MLDAIAPFATLSAANLFCKYGRAAQEAVFWETKNDRLPPEFTHKHHTIIYTSCVKNREANAPSGGILIYCKFDNVSQNLSQ